MSPPYSAAFDLSDPFLLGLEILAYSKSRVQARFGTSFAEQVFARQPGVWSNPIASPYGLHLVRVEEKSAPEINRSGTRVTIRWSTRCGDGSLMGRQIGVAGLRERGTDAVLRAHLADGRLVQAVPGVDAPTLTIPAHSGRFDVMRDYLRLGFEHILNGPVHLLFVLGLVLLVRGWRRLVWTITAFTVGHSITLSLAVLGVVDVPPQPVEVLIAVSIVVVAVELVRGGRESWIHRLPWSIAIALGLLHGLGFAGALTKVGLPAKEVPMAPFAFNIGIELGQLLCVALILAVMACW